MKEAIAALLVANDALIGTKRSECGTNKTALTTAATGLDNNYLFGQNGEFINEDMSLRFSSPPISLQAHVPERTQQVIDVETNHIALYYCDKTLYKFKQTSLILQGMQSETGLDVLVSDILEAIKHLGKEKVDELKIAPANLMAWITEYIDQQVEQELTNRGIVYEETLRNRAGEGIFDTDVWAKGKPYYMGEHRYETTRQDASQFLATAGDEVNDMLRLAVAQSFETTEEDLRFQYYQGWEYVGNMDRAYYLEAIARDRDHRMSATIDGEDPESVMPIRVEKTVGGRNYTMLLDNIKLSMETGVTLDTYFVLEIPSTGQKLVFKALNVPFSPSGLSAANTKLALASDINIRLNNAAKLVIIGSSGETFVSWDCNGFAGMGIKADVEFCRDYMVPLLANMDIDPNEDNRVRAHFTVHMPAWGEFLAGLSIDKFALAKHPDYKWQIQNAWLDFSEISNPSNFTDISSNYFSEFKQADNGFKPQWKGFFLENLTITLPKKFSGENTAPYLITAQKLIIDDRGLTGLIGVQGNIISLDHGNMDGWAFSMNKFKLAIVANRVQGGEFGGLINVPIFKAQAQGGSSQPTQQDCFAYNAKIISTESGEYYEFQVQPAGDLHVDIWAAKATLKPNSSLNIKYENGHFNILANLTGSIIVDRKFGSTQFQLPALSFQNIAISNQEPYFRGGTFGLGAEVGANFGGFKLSVQVPELIPGVAGSTTTSFSVGAGIGLVSESSDNLDIGAATSIILDGEMVEENGRQRWQYQDFRVKKIDLHASWRGVDGARGTLYWYKDDPDFGRGFRGRITVQFSGLKKLGDLGVEALAQFGSMGTYKYFMVDAMVKLHPGIPLGGLVIKGFGGGAYYHMLRDETALTGLQNAPSTFNAPEALGASMSGIVYTPNDTVGLGLKAMIVVATAADEEIFNATATFEIVFNAASEGGGVKDISLYGNAQMMAPISFGNSQLFPQPTEAAPLAAKMAISYVFATKTLHGELTLYANINDVLYGAGANNLVGLAVLHFDPEKWYINIGTPNQPLALTAAIDGLPAAALTVKAYICIGTAIPGMPDLPPYVREMTGANNFMANESRRATGKGFAFGASLDISTGNINFLVFYAHLHAGLGFDVMLQKYDGITCSNNDGKPLGINGWYASGQAWAYIDAEIGIHYKSFEYQILQVGAAAALQLKLPNPFWAHGAVGGQYRILGGLVKGKCNFKFTIGKSCDTGEDENVVQYTKLIEELDPADESKGVEVSTKPTAYFGVPVNGDFTLANNDGVEETYHTDLMEARLAKSDGSLVPNVFVYSGDKRQLTLKTSSFLNGNTNYTFTVHVKCTKNGQVVKEETKTVVFKTGNAPDYIPPSNVKSSYPLNGMYNVYRNETTKGYIKLKDAQGYLFDGNEDTELIARFSTKDGMVAEVPATAENGNYIHFDFPVNQLPREKFYRMDLIYLYDALTIITDNVPTSGNRPHGPAPDDDLMASAVRLEKILYQIYFRTSAHDLFMDKIYAFKIASASSASSMGSVMSLSAMMEPFDRIEMEGTSELKPLMQYDAGSSTFGDQLLTLYDQLKLYGFYPYRGAEPDGTFLPKNYIALSVNGNSNLWRASVEGFNAGPTVGSSSAYLVLSNRRYLTAANDLMDFKVKSYMAVSSECFNQYSNTNGVPNPCYPCQNNSNGQSGQGGQGGSTDGACSNNCNSGNVGPDGTTSTFDYHGAPHCCCSPSYQYILDWRWPALRSIYYSNINAVPQPTTGSIHPVNFRYTLPDGTLTTSAISVNFKY